MSRHTYDCGTIAILINETDSSAVAANPHYQNATGLLIGSPTALTGTVKFQVSHDGGSTYLDLQSSGADVTIGAAESVQLTFQGWTHLRVVSGSAEAATRTFTVRAVEDVNDIYC